MTFVVDCMLGKGAEDDRLLSIARDERRTLLTRDHALVARAKARGVACLLIESEVWEEQVRQVLVDLDLLGEVRPFSRCVECNVPLKPLSRENAANLVAPFVLEHEKEFSLCPACGRVFWPGTHHEDMEAKIVALLKGDTIPIS